MIATKINGAIKTINKPLVKVNGTYKAIKNGLVKVNGKWRVFWRYTIINPVETTLLDVDLYKLFGSPTNPLYFELINNGTIGCEASEQSLLVKDFAVGSHIKIVNNGEILGRGGNGGYGEDAQNFIATDGTTAIHLENDCLIVNNGTIGGGGAGCVVGVPTNYLNGTTDGTNTTSGNPQNYNYYIAAYVPGGKGGDLGQDGQVGTANGMANVAGKAGKAIVNNSANSAFINNGNICGANDLEIA